MSDPKRSTDDLISRYAPVPTAEQTSAVASTRKWGVIKLIAAVVLIGLGMGLTFGSSGSTVTIYYGMAWVGAELMLIGLVNAVGGKTWEDLHMPSQIAIVIVGLGVAIAFFAAGMNRF